MEEGNKSNHRRTSRRKKDITNQAEMNIETCEADEKGLKKAVGGILNPFLSTERDKALIMAPY